MSDRKSWLDEQLEDPEFKAGYNVEMIKSLREDLAAAHKEAAKWKRIRENTHGNCCQCQECGQDHDECRCDLDDLADALAAAREEIEKLRASGRLLVNRNILYFDALKEECRERDAARERLATCVTFLDDRPDRLDLYPHEDEWWLENHSKKTRVADPNALRIFKTPEEALDAARAGEGEDGG